MKKIENTIQIYYPNLKMNKRGFSFTIFISEVGEFESSEFKDYSTCNTALQEFKDKCKDVNNWVMINESCLKHKVGDSSIKQAVLFLKKHSKALVFDGISAVKASLNPRLGLKINRLNELKPVVELLANELDKAKFYRVGID